MKRHFALQLKRVFEYRYGAEIFRRLVIFVQIHDVAKLVSSRTSLDRPFGHPSPLARILILLYPGISLAGPSSSIPGRSLSKICTFELRFANHWPYFQKELGYFAS